MMDHVPSMAKDNEIINLPTCSFYQRSYFINRACQYARPNIFNFIVRISKYVLALFVGVDMCDF